MKKFNKIMSAALVASMVMVSMAGCGSSAETATEAPAAGTTAATEAAAETTAADGATIKIGGIGPITGPAADYGIAVQNGSQLAVDEINANGGINGVQIEYNFQDDVHDATTSVNAYNSLKDWGMQMLMGTVTSGPCQAVVEKTQEDNMFQLTPSGSSVECIKYDNAFRVCFSDPNQGIASADYIADNKLAEKVAIIYNSSDVYSSGITEKFTAEAGVKGLEIVSSEAFTADSATDFSVQLQKAQAAGADLVFLPIYYTEASIILTQANTMGYAPAFFGCDGLDGILGVENFDTALAEGVMLLTPFAADAKDDATVAFVTAYEEAYGKTPSQFAADAYDAIYIIKAAAEKAGVTADMSVSDICEAMKPAMLEVSVDGLTGAGMTWSADGEPSKAPKAVKITDGAYAAME
ncbi:MAG: ABC transporter substrate-binding protein [Lachnospiraceae bacterium]|nr:ABC transporter substrate-binding protein [Lachnospiraceae bacterium]